MTFVTKYAPGHPLYSRWEGHDTESPLCTGEHDCQCGSDHDECECEDCAPESVESVTIALTRTVTHTIELTADEAMRVTGTDLSGLRRLLDNGGWYPDWNTMSDIISGTYGSCDETDESIEFESIEEG